MKLYVQLMPFANYRGNAFFKADMVQEVSNVDFRRMVITYDDKEITIHFPHSTNVIIGIADEYEEENLPTIAELMTYPEYYYIEKEEDD